MIPQQIDLEELIAAKAKAAANQKSPTASIVRRQSHRQPSSVADFFSIDGDRTEIGISVEDLCRRAEISTRTWDRLRAGGNADPRTLRRLAAAIEVGAPAPAAPKRRDESILQLVWSASAWLASKGGFDPELVLAQDFSVQKPLNPTWLQAAKFRRCAIHLMVVELGHARVDVAAALSMTRQNVHQALQKVEQWIEDEPSLGEIIAATARLMKGQRA